jgi:hypothetical protein
MPPLRQRRLLGRFPERVRRLPGAESGRVDLTDPKELLRQRIERLEFAGVGLAQRDVGDGSGDRLAFGEVHPRSLPLS